MANTMHYDELRRMLITRRRALENEIQNNLRAARDDASEQRSYRVESGETTEVHPEDELAFALIQMKAEVLVRINEAVRRLDDGTYGYCGECNDLIATPRLRALPFAVRCKDCEEMREESALQHRSNIRGEWRHC